MRRSTAWLLVELMVLAWACGGEGDGAEASDVATAETETDGTDAPDSTEGEAPDNCSLITEEEGTALAGYELEVGGDSILGCGYLTARIRRRRHRGERAAARRRCGVSRRRRVPQRDRHHPRRRRGGHGRGNHPLRGRASVITASGGRLVEMAIVFLLIDPDDTARIEEAAAFAVTALSRWD